MCRFGIPASTSKTEENGNSKASLSIQTGEVHVAASPGTSENRIYMLSCTLLKLLELNRRSIVTRIKELVAIVLPAETYPQHQIEDAELTEFRSIRDDVTHTGRLHAKRLQRVDRSPDDYGLYMHEKSSLLTEFVETIILAMLGWDRYPMDMSWRHWRGR